MLVNEWGNQSRKLILTLIVLDRSGTLILKYWYKTDVEVEYNQIIKKKNKKCILHQARKTFSSAVLRAALFGSELLKI